MVLVSHRHGFAFLKTRKTAGTTIEMWLQPLCAPPGGGAVVERTPAMVSEDGVVGARLVPREEASALDRAWTPHLEAPTLADRLGAECWSRLLKVTAVRNPFDKLLSNFYWHLSARGEPDPRAPADAREAFRAYVRSDRWDDDAGVVHIAGRFQPEVLLRYEALEADLAALRRRLGLPETTAPLPRAKVTRHRRLMPLAAYFDPGAIDVVRRRSEWIFHHAGYAPDPPGFG